MDMVPLISDAETQRAGDLYQLPGGNRHTGILRRGCGMIFKAVRRVFILLLLLTIITFIVNHRNQITFLTSQKVNKLVTRIQTKSDNADSFRQSALEHQKEVDDAVQ